jgi:hypothetical protein
VYTIQNKNYVILIMYNKSNAITCFKCEIKFLENIKLAPKKIATDTKVPPDMFLFSAVLVTLPFPETWPQ